MATQAADYGRATRTTGVRRTNVGTAERWASILGGLGLTAAAARRGSALSRAALGTVGLSLLARGATRYCPVKASLARRSSRGTGMTGQMRSGAAAITSMDAMYTAELQELHSADTQLERLLPKLSRAATDPLLVQRLDDYADEIRSQRQRVDAILRDLAANPREHPDDAMEALIGESGKMLKVGGDANLRDAGLIASVQRIIHYRIATLGTIATYAKTLGRIDEAQSLAIFSDNEKAVDAALTDLAKTVTNPAAAAES